MVTPLEKKKQSWTDYDDRQRESGRLKIDEGGLRREAAASRRRSNRRLERLMAGAPPQATRALAGPPQLDQALSLAISRGDAPLARNLLLAGATFSAGEIHPNRRRGLEPSVVSAIEQNQWPVAVEMIRCGCSRGAGPRAWREALCMLFDYATFLRSPPSANGNPQESLPMEQLDEPSSARMAEVISLAVDLIARMPIAAIAFDEAVAIGDPLFRYRGLLGMAPEPEMIRALLARGVHVNGDSETISWGRSPLAMAISSRRYPAIRELLIAGARADFGPHGPSAFDWARRHETPPYSTHSTLGRMSDFMASTLAQMEMRELVEALGAEPPAERPAAAFAPRRRL